LQTLADNGQFLKNYVGEEKPITI